MIVLDIETSGVDTGRCGIWQIGAFEFENPNNFFLEEACIDDEDVAQEGALRVTGKTEEELRDKSKQSQKQLLINFLEWKKTCKEKINFGHNIGFDIIFLQNKAIKYGVLEEFRKFMRHRSIDLHTIAQMKYKEIHGKYLLKDNGISDMDLKRVLEFCGIPDERREMQEEEIQIQGKSHNALEDCKLEAEAFSRLINGKNLFQEYSQYPIPDYLKK